MTTTVSTITEIADVWGILFPDVDPPSPQQFALWTLLHDVATIRKAFATLAAKRSNPYGGMTPIHMEKFSSSVMNRLTREQGTRREAA